MQNDDPDATEWEKEITGACVVALEPSTEGFRALAYINIDG